MSVPWGQLSPCGAFWCPLEGSVSDPRGPCLICLADDVPLTALLPCKTCHRTACVICLIRSVATTPCQHLQCFFCRRQYSEMAKKSLLVLLDGHKHELAPLVRNSDNPYRQATNQRMGSRILGSRLAVTGRGTTTTTSYLTTTPRTGETGSNYQHDLINARTSTSRTRGSSYMVPALNNLFNVPTTTTPRTGETGGSSYLVPALNDLVVAAPTAPPALPQSNPFPPHP